MRKEVADFIRKNSNLLHGNGGLDELYEKFLTYVGEGFELTMALQDCDINPLDYLKGIPEEFMKNNDDLAEIIIPKHITEINHRAYFGCWDASYLEWHDNINYIGQEAFRGCQSLSEVILPKSVSTISDGCFEGCEALEKVVLPKSISHIDRNAFTRCSSLHAIHYDGRMSEFRNYVTLADTWKQSSAIRKIICKDGELDAPNYWVRMGANRP
jgi:hypothetical protein